MKINPMFRSVIKISTLISIILAVGVVALILYLVSIKKEYSRDILALKEKVTALSNVKMTLQESLKKAVREGQDRKFSLNRETERNKALSEQLAKLFSELSENKSRIVSMDSELKNMRDEGARLKGENTALKNNLDKTGSERKLLAEKVEHLQKIQDSMQKKVQRLLTRSKVELGEVVVKPAMLNGKILKADKKYNFVIIDLGRNDGIQVGIRMTAYRADKEIGDIKIEKVYDELSVGSAAFEWRGKELDIGDTVKGKV